MKRGVLARRRRKFTGLEALQLFILAEILSRGYFLVRGLTVKRGLRR